MSDTTPQLPKDDCSERVVSTTLCIEEVNAEGRTVRRFCVTVPGEYAFSSPAPKGDSTGGTSAPPARKEGS